MARLDAGSNCTPHFGDGSRLRGRPHCGDRAGHILASARARGGLSGLLRHADRRCGRVCDGPGRARLSGAASAGGLAFPDRGRDWDRQLRGGERARAPVRPAARAGSAALHRGWHVLARVRPAHLRALLSVPRGRAGSGRAGPAPKGQPRSEDMSATIEAAQPRAQHKKPSRGGIGGALLALGALLLKFFKLLLIPLKLLKFAKFGTTIATMALTTWLYAGLFGLRFAAGFVLLIFLHEMGHAAAMKLCGLRAGAPVFIPFFG